MTYDVLALGINDSDLTFVYIAKWSPPTVTVCHLTKLMQCVVYITIFPVVYIVFP